MLAFDEVLRTAGFEKQTLIASAPRWQLWDAEFRGPAKKYKETLVYLTGDFTWIEVEEVSQALRARKIHETTTVVKRTLANSTKDDQRLAGHLKSVRVVTLDEFLLSTIERAFNLGAQGRLTREDFGLDYFVEPHVQFPTAVDTEPAVRSILSWLRSPVGEGPNVAVLLASAGVGKSTVCQEVFRSLLAAEQSGFIPLLIKREQWIPLVGRDQMTLNDIWRQGIAHCYPSALIGSGQVDVCLAGGAICPVLDGFDELCSLSPIDFQPTEVVHQLVELFDHARVLITSRAQFWEDNVAPSAQSLVSQVELQAFSGKQRSAYLRNRFPSDPMRIGIAERILDRLATLTSHTQLGDRRQSTIDERLDLMPLVVMLAAESADTDQPDTSDRYGKLMGSDDPLDALLLVFCERERERQGLRATPRDQMRMFEVLACEFGENFGRDELDLAFQDVIGSRISREVDRLSSHQLLKNVAGAYRFQYDYVFEYLVARVIRRWIYSDEDDAYAASALRLCVGDRGYVLERAAELIVATHESDREGHISRRLSALGETVEAAGLVRVAQAVARREYRSDPAAAADALLRMIGTENGEVRRVYFTAAIIGFNLSGVCFSGCTFENVDFVACSMDEITRFVGCKIEGKLGCTDSDSLGLASFENCHVSPTAQAMLGSLRSSAANGPPTESEIVATLVDALRALEAPGAGFKTKRIDNLRRRLSDVAFGSTMLQILEDTGVLEIEEKKDADSYKVKATADVRALLQNAVQVGRIKTAVDRLVAELVPR